MNAIELLQMGLNGAAPVVWDEFYDQRTHTRRKTRNADATEAAEQKLAAIQGRFSLWVGERRPGTAHPRAIQPDHERARTAQSRRLTPHVSRTG
jgi:hypothetical protein